MTPIAPLIEAFLRETLARQRGVSRHTQASYALSFQLLFEFAAKRLKVSPSALTLEQIDARLVSAFLEHLVVFFRGQNLTPAQFLAFARGMGEPVEYPFVKGLPEHPEIIQVIKLEHERTNFGGIWHTDTAYLELPPMGSMLLAREVPPVGGDTLFANQYLAYETLSSGMRRLLDGLTGDQRVFLGWAQAWAGKATPEEIKRYTISDPHSFRKYRVNGVVPNIDQWYAAFGVKPGDALYIPKEKRARIW